MSLLGNMSTMAQGGLSILNPSPKRMQGPDLLHQLVTQTAAADAIAIEYVSDRGSCDSLTYDQLHSRSDILASRLRTLARSKVPSNSGHFIIPCYIPQCSDLYVSHLGVLKSGGAFCPIALDSPEERVRFILQDVEASFILTLSSLRDQLPSLDGVDIIEVDKVSFDDGKPEPTLTVESSRAAYVMYTSGSTGTPKGVVVSHAAATQALLAHDRHIPAFSRFLQFASPTFDVSVFEIFFPLFRGATLVSCDRRRLLNDLPDVISQLNIDAAELTPSVVNSLLEGRESVPPLKLLLTIGEMLKKSIVEEFGGDRIKESILWGMYGPTEAAIHCTLQPAFTKEMSVGNIGMPLDTVSTFVVNTSTDLDEIGLQILPIGEKGELVVGGHQLADGYLNRPEQTRAAFIHHPDYGLLYRTGDSARMTRDGRLECMGRISSGQAKVRGQRIELGEIEYAAAQTVGCKSVVADVVDGTLVAFCVCVDSSITPDDIRVTCSKWLPAFMVPGDVVLLDSLPYLVSAKVDRKALSQYYSELRCGPPSDKPQVDLRSSQVAEVISGVLGANIDRTAPLSSAGLDSLSAIRIATRLRRSGFLRVDANDLLEARSITDIEKLLNSDQEARSSLRGEVETVTHEHLADAALSHPLVATHADQIQNVYPCTPMQIAMLAETAKEPKAYCNWIQFEISGNFYPDQIQRALQMLSEQHELLRSGFLTGEGVVSRPSVLVWKDLSTKQIRVVQYLDYDFCLQTDADALRPCLFQIMPTPGKVCLLLKIHHALYDQWSIDIFKADLTALLHGRPVENRPSFGSISGIYTEILANSLHEKSVEFWREHLRSIAPRQIRNMAGHAATKELKRTKWQEIAIDLVATRADSRELGYSLPAIFQAALSWLLASYTGNCDVTFGTVFSGRHFPVQNIEDIFGPCLCTLPSRIDVSTVRTSLDLFRLNHDRNRAMQRHAFTPLVDIKSACGSSTDTMLFDTLFVWQESTVDTKNLVPTVIEVDSADYHEFAFVLEFQPSEQSVDVRATYQQQIIPTEQVELILRQFSSIVSRMAQYPSDPVETLDSTLTPDLLSISNPRPSPAQGSSWLVASIESNAQERPDSEALAFASEITPNGAELISITYLELNDRANRLANFLLSLGILPDDLVCICMEKSVNLYVSILAVIKAGAGYLPLTPETPESRIQSILGKANVKVSLCDMNSSQKLRSQSISKIVEIDETDIERYSPENPAVTARGSDVAYTVFTSGSTGVPKGVVVTRENLAGNLAVLSELYCVQPGDRLLQACSQAFDVSVFEIFFAFTTGMCLCSATKEILFHDIEHSIRTLGITYLSLTPTVAALINPANVPNIRFLVTAGEGVTETVRSKWAGSGLHQGYGPSETTNICTINMNMHKDDALGNIGLPLSNTSAFVVSPDAGLRLLPAGALGEFAFGGQQVFRGYLGSGNLNATKLVIHPQYGRLYRSGDIGRILHDGSLIIVGRLDDQVKIRGNRMELGEVNSMLLQDSGVADCVSLVDGNEASDQRLASFWLSKNSNLPGSNAVDVAYDDLDINLRLFQRLESSVPFYMVPDVLVPITKMPLTSQGKLDRKLLLSILAKLNEGEGRYFRHSSNTNDDDDDNWSFEAAKLARALAEVLHVPQGRINRVTSFFAFGLNSLNAIAFARTIEANLHQRVTIGMVLQNPSIMRLTKALAAHAQTDKASSLLRSLDTFTPDALSAIAKECKLNGWLVEKILPCTPLQEAMLSASMAPGSTAYSNSTVFRVCGDILKIKNSWCQLVDRHTILRTYFVPTDSTTRPFAQIIVENKEVPWYSEKEIRSRRSLTDQTNYQGPAPPSMFQPFYFMVDKQEQTTFVTLHMHHAIYDGISMSILLAEAEKLYYARSLPAAPSFEPFLLENQSQNSQQAIQFWSARFHDYQPKPIPTLTYSVPSESVVRDALQAVRPNMEAFCKRHSVTALSLFQAAWSKILGCTQDTSDICFGNIVSGRSVSVPGVEKLAAPCFNTIPIRVDLDQSRSNLQLLRHLQTYNIETVDYQLTPLRRIQATSKQPHIHLFDSMILLQPPTAPLDPNIWAVVSEEGTMDIPAVLELVPEGEDYTLLFHHMRSRISDKLAGDMIRAFIAALADIMAFPSGAVYSLEGFDTAVIAGKLVSNVSPTQNETPQDTGNEDDTAGDQWTSTESKVREIFASLGRTSASRIKKHTKMYQVGLDSLNAPQIAARLRSCGLKIDATDVIECQTPAEIAAKVGQGLRVERECRTIDLEDYERRYRHRILKSLSLDDQSLEAVRPCTDVQNGMLAQSLRTSGKLYVNHITHEVPETVTYENVYHAWKLVQNRHQALRTGFCHTDDPQRPFLMAIRDGESALLPIVRFDNSPQLEDLERQAANETINRLHLAAWTVSIFPDQGSLSMTLTIHHALYDADSLQFLLSDLSQTLLHQPLPPSPNIDAVLLAALNRSPPRADDSEAFWKETLQNASNAKFPDLCPIAGQRSEMCQLVHISNVPTSSCEEFCKQKSVTVQAIGQAVWAQLLSAYTGTDQVTFGTVFSGRSGSERERTAFPSISTIPVCCSSEMPLEDVVHSMIDYNTSVYRHSFTSLADIQRFAGNSVGSLFDTLFVYKKTLHGVDYQFDWPLVRETASVDYVLSLEIEMPSDGFIIFRLTADVSRVPEAQGTLILEQCEHLLATIITPGQRPIENTTGLYSILPPKKRKLSTTAKFLQDFVTEGASTHPDRVAFYFVRELDDIEQQISTWTYKQLDQRGNQVACLLRYHGIEAGNIIAVRMDKCPEASFAFLGILKAGCSFLALDPGLPEARQEFILADSGAKILFLSGNDDQCQPPNNIHTLVLRENDLSRISDEAVDTNTLDPSTTCYCLYTSGTTGTPKGCEITHENAVQAMLAFQRLFTGHWDKSSRWLQFASYWFDVSVLEQFWSWSVGISVVGAPRDLVLDDLAAFIRRLRITHIDLTPSLARLLHPDDVPTLHDGVFITGGEALKQEIIDAWGPMKVICNGYGPTEATIGVTMNPFIGSEAKPSNIGRQFDNVGSYVLAPDSDTPVLRGAIGELCVSGKLVGKGYLNRLDLTAKCFPYLNRFGERIYRTGDLVRLLADGSFAFLGRKDTQAKIRGQRLEVSEIDNVIKTSSEKIAETTSLVVRDEIGGKEQLVSFVTSGTSRGGAGLHLENTGSNRELVRAADRVCRERLPGYMVPTHIIPVNFFPLTVNNKIDSKSLTSLFRALSIKSLQELKSSDSKGGPINDHELGVRNALAKMLNIRENLVTRDANVFALGLSSVSAITFAGLLKREGFIGASITLIMQNPTVSQLAYALHESSSAAQKMKNLAKQSALSLRAFSQRQQIGAAHKLFMHLQDIEAITPCTPLQEGLILESLRDPELPYFNQFKYLLNQPDIGRLQLALQTVADNIQLLRARFIQTDDGFAQVILRKDQFPCPVLPSNEQNIEQVLENQKIQWLKQNHEELLQPIKPVIVQSGVTFLLVIFVHHALYDGISWQLLLECITKTYCNQQVPDCGPQFTDALPHGPLCCRTDAKSFWTRKLASFQFVSLTSTEQPRDRTAVKAAATIDTRESVEVARKGLGVSHHAFIMACFEIALHCCFPRTRTYGQVVSGRSIELDGADRVIGPLFNSLPRPLDLDARSTWTEMINRVNADNVETLPFQHTPLRDIRRWCGREPSSPMFDVLFVFQHGSESSGQNVFELFKELEQPVRADYPLAFEATLRERGVLDITVVAQSSIADNSSLRALLKAFTNAVQAASTTPDNAIGDQFALPEKTSHATVDKSLKAPVQLNGGHEFDWSRQALELRDVIAQVAGIDVSVIDEHSSIFSLGLDSIDAVKLTSRAKKAGIIIPVSKILQAQTIPRMLQTVENDGERARSENKRRMKLTGLERRLALLLSSNLRNQNSVERILPATPSQEALIANMLRSGWQDYYNHDILRLNSGVDMERLEDAWQNVVDRSPILRTGFAQVNDPTCDATFAQIVYRPFRLSIQKVLLDTNDDLQKELKAITDQVRANHQGQPLLRLNIFTISSAHYLVLSLSHAQYDGHSLALLHNDIYHAYQDSPVQRPSYFGLLEEALAATGDESRDFWNNSISGVRPSSFPRLAEEDARTTVHRAERVGSVSVRVARSFCQARGISLQALAQTCWALLLASYTRTSEVIFGIVLACRDSEEAEQVMFPTMNTVPMRAALHGSKAEMLQYIQHMINDIRAYQRTPLRTIQASCVETVGISEGGSLFDTIFIYQHKPEITISDGERLYESVGGSSNIEYPVAVEMEAIGEELILRTACKSSVLSKSGAEHLLEQLNKVLTSILDFSEEPTISFAGNEARVCDLPPFPMDSAYNVEHKPISAPQDGSDIITEDLSPTALTIRAVLSAVSKVPEASISPTTTIESIGIDSISAIKVVALLRKEHIILSVSEILRAKAIAQMVTIVDTKPESGNMQPRSSAEVVTEALRRRGLNSLKGFCDIEPEEVEMILPATAGQLYMLSVWQESSGQLFYPKFVYRVQGKVDMKQIRHAWSLLVARHTTLRTKFCATKDTTIPMVQVVLKEVKSSFSEGLQDVSVSGSQPMASLHAEQQNGGYLLNLKIHHALYDAVSLPLLIQDFKSLASGHRSPLPSLRYEDLLAQTLMPGAEEARKAFWISYFKDLHPMHLPEPTRKGAQKRIEIFRPRAFSKAVPVELLARQEGVTFQGLLFAAYAKVYAELVVNSRDTQHDNAAEDVALGIYLANRSHLPDLSQLRAPTLNLVPLLVRSPAQKSLLELAKQIQTDLQDIGTVENSAASLWEIARWTGVKVDTFVNFLKLPEQNETQSSAQDKITITEIDEHRTNEYSRVAEPTGIEFEQPVEFEGLSVAQEYSYSLDVEATVADNALDIGLFCPEDVVRLESAEGAVKKLGRILEQIVEGTSA